MKIITKAYKCDFCGRVFATASGAKRHEKACKENPENKCCCVFCPHLDKKSVEIPYDPSYEFGVPGYPRTITTFHCTKKGIDLFHPKVLRMDEHRRNAIMKYAQKMPLLSEGCDDFTDPRIDDTMQFLQ